jgi:hypothetical protein
MADTQSPPSRTSSDPPSAVPPSAAARRRRGLSYFLIGGAALTAALALGTRGRSLPQPLSAPAPVPPAVVLPTPTVAPAPPAIVKRPRVELVFALDTTGSMSGLIEGAKRKIWSLASFVAQGQPTPELRVGLIAYRDIGDAYVTRLHDLDDDLDQVYQRLQAFRADGGGDTPEHVGRALHEAVHKISWSQESEVVKIVYLVGDAPAHTDYRDGFDYARAARMAANKGIQIHAVRCGSDGQTEGMWRQIARLGRGQYLSIEQSGGMREDHTPFDDELARLHDELGATALAYGSRRHAMVAARTAAALAPASVKADRARFLAIEGKAVSGAGDLLDATRNGSVRLAELESDALPPELRSKSPAEQQALLDARQKRRETIVRQISNLTRKRQEHLEAAASAAAKSGAREGFDVVAKRALRKSVADKPAAGLKL